MNTVNLSKVGYPWVLRSEGHIEREAWSDHLARAPSKIVPAHIDEECRDLGRLYSAIGGALNFPDYFGRNLAALRDCLNDGDIVPFDGMCLVINHGHTLLIDEPTDALEGLIETLALVGREWAKGGSWPWNFPPRPFHAVFQETRGDPRYEQLPLLSAL